MFYETRFLLAWLLTLVIEVPILFILVKFVFKIKTIKNLDLLTAGVIATTLTIPYLWFVLPAFFNARYYVYLGEGMVTIVEAIIYSLLLRIDVIRALIISIVANMASYYLGLLIFKYIL